MKIIRGKYSDAKVFTNNIDDVTVSQIEGFLNEELTKEAHVRIMPDCHAGKGAVIGTTMKVTDRVVPNLVGVDIGCGMLCVEIKKKEIDFAELDAAVRALVPSGQSIRTTAHDYIGNVQLDKVLANFSEDAATLSLGTLGGGNHFIEMNETEDGRLFLVIHSGSRHLGVKVANFHQKKAIESLTSDKEGLNELIAQLKAKGRHQEIHAAMKSFKSAKPVIPNDLAYLQGALMEDYFNDLKIAQDYAKWNRAAMMQVLMEAMNFEEAGRIDTVHNYIDLEHMILRKGAISARKDELVLIPINMRDGSLLAKGKGNDDWNQSGPHGAGRILSRTKAKELLQLDDFTDTMKNVYTTSVNQDTIDESPFAYKTMEEIINNTIETIEIQSVLKPVYNFKAAEFQGWRRK
ncbi:RtcB family protein [Planococcus shenhongbingii]|uniref:3'-phosphate/5'-hydroxy nucleic acid ligase n=1 Tax=Planococcus shenhongbingii TaxID=3058398 RepID=A0ABT8N7L0_9BACL|nr:RtcB family protein [Planococcus sp. N017]MDN7243858.1 RtcB family protein [Planococcus sp. N017]